MKGIVFTELIQMVNRQFGEDLMDDVFDTCTLESGGAYTTIGTYDHRELLAIVGALSQKTGLSVKELVLAYGQYLFFRFRDLMPQFFDGKNTVFDFLESVHGTIHVEVKKIYPDAQLPHFQTQRVDKDTFSMTYSSRCPFADFAEGLIRGCIDYYQEPIALTSQDSNQQGQYGRVFTLKRSLS